MRLRTDARRNLRQVLTAAREVFGEQGYGAPMEEVARRAGVGVGTVYRRFPSKETLVRFIAEEEIQRLTDRARETLRQADGPWEALEHFVRSAAGPGTGRLLPAGLLPGDGRPGPEPGSGSGADSVQVRAGELLAAMGRLVDGARAAGALRADVTVADVLLVIATTPPAGDDAARQAAASERLREILLRGLRALPAAR
ncbi:hypothetical protein GCM10009716_42720 [Streptomyces sodiiphilus]|uniref:HTH tetR-type domain-containing protein n=1 Tax=Streptomyces sodiiphilus TaxID=226217 RepID=A0ABN2PS65_9ACTN